MDVKANYEKSRADVNSVCAAKRVVVVPWWCVCVCVGGVDFLPAEKVQDHVNVPRWEKSERTTERNNLLCVRQPSGLCRRTDVHQHISDSVEHTRRLFAQELFEGRGR
jgi:hypothetical protein